MSATKEALFDLAALAVEELGIPAGDFAAFQDVMRELMSGPCCMECKTADAERAPGETFDIPAERGHLWAWAQDQHVLAGNMRWRGQEAC